MGATAALLFASLVAAAPSTPSAPTKVLLLPLAGDATGEARALRDALAARLAAERGFVVLPAPRLAAESSIAGDERLRTEIDEALARVQDAYRRLDVDEATRLLQSLENARLSELGCPERIALAGRISFWLGVVYAAKKDTARAMERFSTVLSIDSSSTIDAKYFPPATVALFEKVRKSLGAAQTGGLSLSAEPEGARVYVNGKLAGQVPVTLTAADGDHFVCVRKLGWKDWAARLHLSAGRVDTQRIYLQRASPDEVARQLGLVLGSGPARLDDAAHVEALGAALSADVVVEVRAPATLAWREVRAPGEAHEFVAPSVASPAETVAGELAVAFSEALGVRPSSSARPEGATVTRRFDLEAAAFGGLTFGMGRGGFFGGRLGLWWNVKPTLGFGLSGGVAKGFGDLGLADPNVAERLVIATATANLEVPLALGLRWHVVRAGDFRLSLQADATLRLLSYGSPTVVPNLPPIVPLVTIPPTPPLAFSTLGPHFGLSASYALHPAFALVFGATYGFEFGLARPDITALLQPRGGGAPLTVRITSDLVRHTLLFDLGVQVRFE